MLGKKRDHRLTVQNATCDLAAPVVTRFDLGLVEPDIMAPGFQASLDALNERRVGIMGIAEEDFHGTAETSSRLRK